jgi:hypothetical protein
VGHTHTAGDKGPVKAFGREIVEDLALVVGVVVVLQ